MSDEFDFNDERLAEELNKRARDRDEYDFRDAADNIGEMAEALAVIARDRQIATQKRVMESETDLIADQAWLCWSKDGLRFFLCESPVWKESEGIKREQPKLYAELRSLSQFGRFNGYVRFPKLPVVAPGIHGILDYVPVHGGITYCQEWWDGSVTYGFDTAHAWSMEMPEIVNDVDWMMQETESMGRAIQIAARFEHYYLQADEDNERKARVLDRMGKFLPVYPFDKMHIMLNLMRGEL